MFSRHPCPGKTRPDLPFWASRELGFFPRATLPPDMCPYKKFQLSNSWDPSHTAGQTYHGGIFGMDFTPDGSVLGVATERRDILFFDPLLQPSKPTNLLPKAHSDCVNTLKFLDNRMFVSCSDDHTIRLWDLRYLRTLSKDGQAQPISVLRGHTNWVKNIEYAEGGMLLSSAFDENVLAWNLNKPDEPPTKLLQVPGLMRMRLTANEDKLIIGNQWGYLLIVHNLDLKTLAKDFEKFSSTSFWIAAQTQGMFPAPNKDQLSRFTADRNRAELVMDFPTDCDPDTINTVAPHPQLCPQGWCVASRCNNGNEQSEWTCLHDIQLPSVEESLIQKLSKREKLTEQEPMSVDEMIDTSESVVGIRSSDEDPILIDSEGFTAARARPAANRYRRARRPTRVISLNVYNRNEEASSDEEGGQHRDEDRDADISQQDDDDSDTDSDQRSQQMLAQRGELLRRPAPPARRNIRNLLAEIGHDEARAHRASFVARQQPRTRPADELSDVVRQYMADINDRPRTPIQLNDSDSSSSTTSSAASNTTIRAPPPPSAALASLGGSMPPPVDPLLPPIPWAVPNSLADFGRRYLMLDQQREDINRRLLRTWNRLNRIRNRLGRPPRRQRHMVVFPPYNSTLNRRTILVLSNQETMQQHQEQAAASSSTNDAASNPTDLSPHVYKRLIYYQKEPRVGRGYIKELCWSPDGRVLASPFSFGIRLSGFDSRCSELSDLMWNCDTNLDINPPIELTEIGSTLISHNNVVLTSQFSPVNIHLLATGCLGGRVNFYQPKF